jgi:hypothetical protein
MPVDEDPARRRSFGAKCLTIFVNGRDPDPLDSTGLRIALRHRIEETFDFGPALELELDTMGTNDGIEAVSAFKEKRGM